MFNKTFHKIGQLRQKLNTRLDRYAKVSAQKLYKKQLWKNNKQEFNYEPHFNPHHEDKNAYQLNETREQEVQKPQLNQHHEDKNAYQLNKIQEQEVQEPQFDQHLEHQQEYYAEVEESSHTITEKPLSCEKKKKHQRYGRIRTPLDS
ncbi:hypothetical protein EV183_002918 [Coemansia sp. RSA 2336]|nr:hypothetical protein EV183_002918 [Coemansia sp. RSA 2336]